MVAFLLIVGLILFIVTFSLVTDTNLFSLFWKLLEKRLDLLKPYFLTAWSSIVQYFVELKNREVHLTWSFEKKFIFWLIVSTPFAIFGWYAYYTSSVIIGCYPYVASTAVFGLIMLGRYMNLKIQYKKAGKTANEVEKMEEVQKEETPYYERYSEGKGDLVLGYEVVVVFVKKQFAKAMVLMSNLKSIDGKKKWEPHHDLLFWTIMSLLIAIPSMFGYILEVYGLALFFLFGMILVNNFTDYRLVSVLDNKANVDNESPEQDIVFAENEAKTEDLEKCKSAYQRLRGRVLDMAGITVCKDLKPAMKKLKEELEAENN